jgi:hypothetical protein
MDTETLILAAAQIASGMTAGRPPSELVQEREAGEIARAAVAIARAIADEADS